MINYINFAVDGYGEGISYLLLTLIIYLYLKEDDNKAKFFFIGLLSFVVIGIRPNYLGLLCPLIFAYIIYLFFKKHQIKDIYLKFFLLLFGFSFLLLIPLHNYIYSNEITLLVKTTSLENNLQINYHDYIEFFLSFFSNNEKNIDYTKILLHLSHYIKIYEFWFLIILINLFFVIFFKIDLKLKILSLSLILMHTTFLFFKGDPRYSMGTWLLSFIIFLYMFKKKYYFFFKKKLLKN
jgi:hypothetical protein